MTLLEITNFVCTKVRENSADAVAACKTYVRQRYEMLYHEALWRDGVGRVTVNVDPTGLVDGMSYVTVVAAGTGTTNPNTFVAGTVLDGVTLAEGDLLFWSDTSDQTRNGVWQIVVDPDITTCQRPSSLTSASYIAGVLVTVEDGDTYAGHKYLANSGGNPVFSLDADSMAIRYSNLPNESLLNAQGIVTMPNICGEILAVRSSLGEIYPENPEVFFRMDFDAFAQVGNPTSHHQLPDSCLQFPAGRYVWLAYENAADIGSQIYLKWTDGNQIYENHFTIGFGYPGADFPTVFNGSFTPLSFNGASIQPTSILSFSKPATSGKVYLVFTEFPGPMLEYGDFHTLEADLELVLQASDTNCPRRRILRLVSIPQTSLTLYVLVKHKLMPLSDDNDTPILRNVDNYLIAMAQADMLERARQYAKAQDKMAEGVALIKQVKQVATLQQSNERRLIPECVDYSPEDFQTKGYW